MWTIQQQKAINKTDSDLLLTASAGSGKTAVLTERFLELIINSDKPCDIDKILVVTFTRAAVSEMRKRIGERLLRHVEDHPGDVHARRQLSLLNCAQICTIDSYSSSLLKDYFYLADIDPAFDIIDPKEKSLVLSKIMDELLEDFYSGQSEISTSDFIQFAKIYGGRSGDSQLPAIIRSLANFLDTLVDADSWLQYCIPDSESLDSTCQYFQSEQIKLLNSYLKQLVSYLEAGEKLLDGFVTVSHYREYISPTLEILNTALTKVENNRDILIDVLSDKKSLPLSKALSRKSKGIDQGEKDAIVAVIQQAREHFKNIPDELLINQNVLKKQLSAVNIHVSIITNLYQEYVGRYRQFKSANKVLDYSDVSHKVLQVLNDKGKPSIAAIEQQKQYEYILVDEYQDISPLQEALFSAIKRNSNGAGNMFMVGDLKQSIYRFRQADPGIILDKHNSYDPVFDGDIENDIKLGCSSRIELSKNFRSRKEIISFVNYVFDRCATEEFGGLNYASDGRMLYGADYYDDYAESYCGENLSPIELHLIDNKAELDADNVELADSNRREAVLIAQRIKKMIEGDTGIAEFNVLCPEKRIMRPVEYRDISILLRSPKSQAQTYSEVFQLYGIPLYVQQEGGFFDSVEIADILNILKVVDNPKQDIPLAAVLRSPVMNLTEDKLAHIRSLFPNDTFYSAVLSYSETGSDKELCHKLSEFMESVEYWRNLARRGKLAALIRRIYSQTGLLIYYRGLKDGRQRYANLLFLYDTARDYDSFSTQGLGRFLRFVEDLSEQPSEDFGPAKVLSESDNVVQLMSVHKSKGLEFPVVIAAGLGKKFNLRDISKSIFYAPAEQGAIALKLRDPETGESWKTLPYSILTEKERLQCLYEELRVQYVALTRAREHLILFADTNLERLSKRTTDLIAEKGICSQAGNVDREKSSLSFNIMSSAATPIDWYSAALAEHPDFVPISGVVSDSGEDSLRISVSVYSTEEINDAGIIDDNSDEDMFEIDELVSMQNEPDSVICTDVLERADWQYPSLSLAECPARASVTAMNTSADVVIVDDSEVNNQRMADDELYYVLDAEFSRKPLFMLNNAEKLSAAEIGVLTHKYIELIDLDCDGSISSLENQMKQMVQSGCFTEQQAKYVNIESISNMLSSDIGKIIINDPANTFREWEFTLAVPADEIYSEKMGSISNTEDNIIVRGIIDCLVWDGKSYTIIDFKTDDVNDDKMQARADHYKFQLDFYSRAVEEITGKDVSSRYLYFLKPGIAVNI